MQEERRFSADLHVMDHDIVLHWHCGHGHAVLLGVHSLLLLRSHSWTDDIRQSHAGTLPGDTQTTMFVALLQFENVPLMF